MLKGIHLTLMIGPAVPIPAPQSVIDAITSIQVTSGRDRSGFQITFAVSKRSPLLKTMLPAGYFDPMITRVIIIVTLGGIPNVLMDGIVTRQEIQPSNEPGQSTFTITGEDLSVLMDVVQKIIPYPAMPEVAQIYLALAPYAMFGVVPVAIPPIISALRIPTNGFDSQLHTTDLQFVKGRASECGYVFYVEPGPLPGQSIAYFGPDIRIPVPQPALNVNMDAHTNVESLSFSLDGLAKKVRIFMINDPITHKIPIPIPAPNINAFKPPLGLRPTPPAKIEFADDVAQMSPTEAARGILAYFMNNSEAISGSGTLDVLRYGRVLRSRMLVGVRGAGLTYDGLYYVDSVTHNVKRGEYKQNFSLSRDGLISNTPRLVA
ncbi:MAG: hypothetical protein OEP48_09080 [Betaproteobacteria bacterium]|nr:hypothetical protein [Betaproteobacteria bacterium]MDH3435935.1 hypothetical protein [Betaproteobacteria bacterium]